MLWKNGADVCSSLRNNGRLKGQYTDVKFLDMAFDTPEAHVIRNLPECQGFAGLPFTVYYKNGKVAKATSSIQSMDQITEILDSEYKS